MGGDPIMMARELCRQKAAATMLCGGRPSSQPLAEGNYHGLLSIEIEDPLMPNNLKNLLSHANECVKGGFNCLTRIERFD